MIMNKLLSKLPLLAFVLAAFTAVAFTSPVSDEPQYGTPDGGVTWVQINDPENPVNYQCDPGSEACLYADESMDHPIGNTNRKFTLIP
jgi:hypothetical protein